MQQPSGMYACMCISLFLHMLAYAFQAPCPFACSIWCIEQPPRFHSHCAPTHGWEDMLRLHRHESCAHALEMWCNYTEFPLRWGGKTEHYCVRIAGFCSLLLLFSIWIWHWSGNCHSACFSAIPWVLLLTQIHRYCIYLSPTYLLVYK